jgi:hypothetical protein
MFCLVVSCRKAFIVKKLYVLSRSFIQRVNRYIVSCGIPFCEGCFIALSCHIVSFYVICCHFVSCCVMSFLTFLCLFMSFHVFSCLFMSFHVFSCLFVSFHAMSCFNLFWSLNFSPDVSSECHHDEDCEACVEAVCSFDQRNRFGRNRTGRNRFGKGGRCKNILLKL